MPQAAHQTGLAHRVLHLLLWCRDRRSWANLCFSFTVVGVLGLAISELITMHTDSPEVFGHVFRWDASIRRELSSSLAHELNQPLAIILTNAQAAQRLPLSVNEIIEDVLRIARSDLIGRGATVQTALAESVPPVLGDRIQLQQVLLNLILNASDAMAANPPALRHLTITTAHRDGSARISVSDNGCGLRGLLLRLVRPEFLHPGNMQDGQFLQWPVPFRTSIRCLANEDSPAEDPGEFGMRYVMVRSVRKEKPKGPKWLPVQQFFHSRWRHHNLFTVQSS